MQIVTKHVRVHGEKCPCGKYHYTCAICGCDCTEGKPKAPAVTSGGVTRCSDCSRTYDTRPTLTVTDQRDRVHIHPWEGDTYHTIIVSKPDGYADATVSWSGGNFRPTAARLYAEALLEAAKLAEILDAEYKEKQGL